MQLDIRDPVPSPLFLLLLPGVGQAQPPASPWLLSLSGFSARLQAGLADPPQPGGPLVHTLSSSSFPSRVLFLSVDLTGQPGSGDCHTRLRVGI